MRNVKDAKLGISVGTLKNKIKYMDCELTFNQAEVVETGQRRQIEGLVP